MKRVAIAKDTIKILEAGFYQISDDQQVQFSQELKSCLRETKYYDPDTLSQIEQEVLSQPPQFSQTEFEVRNETTLTGAKRLAKSGNFQEIGVLNFASARNPGGGFLKGAQAQEESLARSSALYKSLLKCPQYYDFHRNHKSLLYSNRMIYSPHCLVFKDDHGTLLETPYFVDFITSPAPNAGAITRNQPENVKDIPEVLRDRSSKILALATHNGCDAIILGAWGCGVFQNDSAMVSQTFADHLLPNGKFEGKFKKVLFSVLDSTKNTKIFRKFEHQFINNY